MKKRTKITHSVFTNDLTKCYLTGINRDIEVHHVFGGALRNKSAEYGYVIPLYYKLHPNGAYVRSNYDECNIYAEKVVDRDIKGLDNWLKMYCQAHYEKHKGTREMWMEEFGRNYIDDEIKQGEQIHITKF